MYGRRDRQFMPRIGPVLRRGWFPLVDGGRARLTLVHADSVAQGALLAVRDDRAGGRIYHLTDDFPIDVATLVRCAAEGLGRPIRSPVLSLAVGRAGFAALALVLRLVGRGDLARHAHGTLQMLTRDNPFTSQRARSELGWKPERRPERDLADAVRWWATRVPVRGGA
jgi:nucleoside-diphosphate-sugar epimerase